jgi:hypothetical protein
MARESDVDFEQKRMASQMRFNLGPTEVRYWVRDNSGEREALVDYANLSGTTRQVFEKNIWLRNVGIMWCLLGVVTVALSFIGGEPKIGSAFWLALGLGCLAFFYLTQSNYTVFDSENGTVFVLADKQHDAIVGELKGRRVARMLELYGDFNPENSLEQERRKFDWLVKEQVLSREEADRRLAAAGGSPKFIDAPGRLLN